MTNIGRRNLPECVGSYLQQTATGVGEMSFRHKSERMGATSETLGGADGITADVSIELVQTSSEDKGKLLGPIGLSGFFKTPGFLLNRLAKGTSPSVSSSLEKDRVCSCESS